MKIVFVTIVCYFVIACKRPRTTTTLVEYNLPSAKSYVYL